MLALFVIKPWDTFYKRGLKTWDIRSYSTNYRGPIIIVDSKSKKIICKAILKDCIPLYNNLWNENFNKHRVLCSYNKLPYRKNGSPGYAWELDEIEVPNETIKIERKGRRPYIEVDDNILDGKEFEKIKISNLKIQTEYTGNMVTFYLLKDGYKSQFMVLIDGKVLWNYNERISSEDMLEIISQMKM